MPEASAGQQSWGEGCPDSPREAAFDCRCAYLLRQMFGMKGRVEQTWGPAFILLRQLEVQQLISVLSLTTQS